MRAFSPFVLALVLSFGLPMPFALAQDEEPSAIIAESITDPDVRSLLDVAEQADFEADPAGTLAAWQAAYDAALAAAPDEELAIAQIGNQLGAAHYYAGNYAEARDYFRAASDVFRDAGPAYAENLQEALGNLGSIQTSFSVFEEAEAAQREALEIRLAIYEGDHPQIARSYFELGALANLQGRTDEASELVRQSLEMRIRSLGEDHPHVAMTRVSLAAILLTARRYQDALDEAQLGLRSLEANLPPGHPFIIFAKSSYAGVLNAWGRYEEAEPFLRQIVDERRAALGDDHPRVAESLNNLAVALNALGRTEEAQTIYHAARDIYLAVEGADSVYGARIRANAAEAAGLGALDERRAALADFDRIGISEGLDRARLLSAVAASLAAAGEIDEALAHIHEAQDISAVYFGEAHEAMLALSIDEAWILSHDPARVGDAIAMARPAARALLQQSALDVDEGRDAARRNDAARRRALDVAYLAGDEELILNLLDGGGSRGLALAVEAAEAREGDGALSALLRARQDAARLVRVREARYVQLRTDGASDDAVTAAYNDWQASRAHLADQDDALPDELHTEREWLTIDALQDALGAGEALLAFAFTDGGGVVAALTEQGITLSRLGIGPEEAHAAVVRLREGLAVGAGLYRGTDLAAEAQALSAFPADASYTLYRGIFTPAIEAAVRDAETLIAVTDGPYLIAPLSVLTTAPGNAALTTQEELRAAPWLVRRHAVVYAPALRYVQSGTDGWGDVDPQLFAIGAPAFSGGAEEIQLSAVLRSGGVNAESLAALPPLPGAEQEINTLADFFGRANATVLIGEDATEEAMYLPQVATANVLVFATHGLLPGELDGVAEPALAFTPPAQGNDTDGLLTASEIAALHLNADWVVLSACNTFVGGDTAPPDRLAEAFLYAGARSLLVSHWMVRDDVAARITAAVARDSADLGRAEAHRHAMLTLLDDESVEGGAHPGVWGPFALIGR